MWAILISQAWENPFLPLNVRLVNILIVETFETFMEIVRFDI